MDSSTDITRILVRWSGGDERALDQLLPVVYKELRSIARNRLRTERDDHTLNTTGLVHEAYLRLIDIDSVDWNDRSHFLAFASQMMRRILVDYARRRNAMRRGGDRQRIDLDEDRLVPDSEVDKLLDFNDALERLARDHPRPAQCVELSYFGGLQHAEAADAVGISIATLERDLRFARAWLARELGAKAE